MSLQEKRKKRPSAPARPRGLRYISRVSVFCGQGRKSFVVVCYFANNLVRAAAETNPTFEEQPAQDLSGGGMEFLKTDLATRGGDLKGGQRREDLASFEGRVRRGKWREGAGYLLAV